MKGRVDKAKIAEGDSSHGWSVKENGMEVRGSLSTDQVTR